MIIRDSPKDWTAELTEKDQVAWLVGHNKIIPEKAIEIAETNKDQMFCVRIPPDVTTTAELKHHILLNVIQEGIHELDCIEKLAISLKEVTQ